MFLLAGLGRQRFWPAGGPFPAQAADRLDAGGLTFRDFAITDNGASFNRGVDHSIGGGTEPGGFTRVARRRQAAQAVRPGAVRARSRSSWRCRMGWQATEDGERGVAYSDRQALPADRLAGRFRLRGRQGRRALRRHQGRLDQGPPARASRPRPASSATAAFLIVYENVPKGQGDSEPRTVFDLVMPQSGQPEGGRADDAGRADERGRARAQSSGSAKAEYADRLVIP